MKPIVSPWIFWRNNVMDDLISKQDALDAIARVGLLKSDTKEVQAVAECLRKVEKLQPVKQDKQKSKIGLWISHREYCEINNLIPNGLGSYFWCSECDCGIDVKEWHRNNYNYCPNCGAKMESEE